MVKYVIVIMAYNRPSSLNRILSHLINCEIETSVDLVISIDKSDLQDSLITIADKVEWKFGNKRVIVRESRLGLRQHVLQCGDIVNDYDVLVMFEDDIVPAKNFFSYIEQVSNFYENEPYIGGISLYSPIINEMVEKPFVPVKNEFDVFLIQSASSWGQSWTKNMWNHFREWYSKNEAPLNKNTDMPSKIYSWPESSWKKYYMKYLIETNKYFVYPYNSLSTNFGDKGQHVQQKDSMFQVPISFEKDKIYNFGIKDALIIYDSFFELNQIPGIVSNDLRICFDFYGSKSNFADYDFLISSKKYNYKIIDTFGLNFKPQELNYIYSNEGSSIFYYNLKEKINNRTNNSKLLLTYYYSTLNWKDSGIVFLFGFKNYIIRKINKFLKILKF